MSARILLTDASDSKGRTHILVLPGNILPHDVSPREVCDAIADVMRSTILSKKPP